MQVDVVLPYYGDVEFMKAAARSVLAQDHRDLRLLVFDDGYPSDEPRRWFAEVAAEDPRVHYERNAENLGANGNYRKGLAAATAPVVVIMGADDIMLPGYLTAAVAAFQAHPGATVFQPGVQVIDEYDRPVRGLVDLVKDRLRPDVRHAVALSGQEAVTGLMRGNWTYFPSLAWRTEAVQRIGFRHGLDVVQDLALLCDVLTDGGELAFDPRLEFLYRRHSESDSSVRALDGRRFAEESRFFATQAEQFDRMGWRGAARAARSHPTSRLNAAAMVPRALRSAEHRAAVGTLLRHVVR